MGLSADQIRDGLDALGVIEPRFTKAIAQVGYPEPRIRPRGYQTLLRTIVGQQVSFKAADAVWAKLEAHLGTIDDPQAVIQSSFDDLRGCGLSRQKQGYARSLAELVSSGELVFDALPTDDEEAIALLTKVKGIGRWSAEIYLLFAEGRPDIWPAGDLAVQIDVGNIMQLNDRPSEKQVRDIAEAWRPHRGCAAIFAWHHYKTPVI
ncbi:MAG: DNA-3-methyladenine glycosylase family protein [Sphingomonadaceae bacterium]